MVYFPFNSNSELNCEIKTAAFIKCACLPFQSQLDTCRMQCRLWSRQRTVEN